MPVVRSHGDMARASLTTSSAVATTCGAMLQQLAGTIPAGNRLRRVAGVLGLGIWAGVVVTLLVTLMVGHWFGLPAPETGAELPALESQ